MKITAHAKINLTLEVLGVRPDGYHDLRSIVMPISLCDDVILEPANDVTVRVAPDRADATVPAPISLAHLGADADNLAVKAAKLLQLETGRHDGVAISITKRIPLGGGLGGGSADAAAVLLGLNDLWKLGLARSDLAALAAWVGSDVPAQVLGGVVLMEGRGERVRCLFDEKSGKIHPFDLVLANPGVHSSTPEVFKAWRRSGLTDGGVILNNMRSSVLAGKVDDIAASLQNDLAAAAYGRYPEIERMAHALKDAGAVGVSLSGSGATVFGLVRNQADGRKVRERLAGVWTALARTCPVV